MAEFLPHPDGFQRFCVFRLMRTTQISTVISDQDSAWKQMLDEYLPAFMEFFFPAAFTEIDWNQPYEKLDKELAQIRPTHDTGKLIADKLFKVWLLNGKPIWLLIHIEVQGHANRSFAKRIFEYNYRLMDFKRVEVVSFVLLTGNKPGKTGKFATERWGCSHRFTFPVIRIIDFAHRWDELEASNNPFAIAIKAQLKAYETKGDHEQGYQWKRNLIFELYRRGYKRKEIINLFNFMDWVIRLPQFMEEKIKHDIFEFEEKNNMPYLSRMELRAIDKGLQQGIEQGLQQGQSELLSQLITARVGELGATFKSRLGKLSQQQLVSLGLASSSFTTKSDLSKWLKENTTLSSASPKR